MSVSYRNLGRNGRLGNQLWQLASTIGIANQRYKNPYAAQFPNWYYSDYFSVPDSFFGVSGNRAKDLGLDYLQDLKYIKGIEPLIRLFFSPSKLVDFERYRYLMKLEHRTAVHVRHGDSFGKEDIHPMCSVDYYQEAMSLIRAEVPETTFVFFSDDIEWCRANFGKSHQYVSPASNTIKHKASNPNEGDHIELFLMASFERHIIANSTFSWWAAWLSRDERVINPSVWYGPALPEWDQRVFIPKTWITLEA